MRSPAFRGLPSVSWHGLSYSCHSRRLPTQLHPSDSEISEHGKTSRQSRNAGEEVAPRLPVPEESRGRRLAVRLRFSGWLARRISHETTDRQRTRSAFSMSSSIGMRAKRLHHDRLRQSSRMTPECSLTLGRKVVPHGREYGVQVDGAAIGCVEHKGVPTEPQLLMSTSVYCRLDLAYPIDVVVSRVTHRGASQIPADQSLLARSAMDFEWLVAVPLAEFEQACSSEVTREVRLHDE